MDLMVIMEWAVATEMDYFFLRTVGTVNVDEMADMVRLRLLF